MCNRVFDRADEETFGNLLYRYWENLSERKKSRLSDTIF